MSFAGGVAFFTWKTLAQQVIRHVQLLLLPHHVLVMPLASPFAFNLPQEPRRDATALFTQSLVSVIQSAVFLLVGQGSQWVFISRFSGERLSSTDSPV
jgi:hypothetical protein